MVVLVWRCNMAGENPRCRRRCRYCRRTALARGCRGDVVPLSFAVAFDSEDKLRRHLFGHTEVCRQGNEQRDYAFAAPTCTGPFDDADVDPDQRWQFVLIARIRIVAGSCYNKQG